MGTVRNLRHADLGDLEFAPGGREQVRFMRVFPEDPKKDPRDGAMLLAANGVVTRVWRFHIVNLKELIARIERGPAQSLDRAMDPFDSDDDA